jgi:type IV pilus assembly protein PilV
MSICVNKPQEGFGLIELMIAVLVFAIGVLGLGSMQLAAKKNLFEASQRATATALARDLLERMRSNRDQLASYTTIDLSAEAPDALVDCRASVCSPGELAVNDIRQWRSLVLGAPELVTVGGEQVATGGLVAPRACITHSSGLVKVSITWRGLFDMTNPGASPCGESAVLYGEGNARRRLLMFTAYLGET